MKTSAGARRPLWRAAAFPGAVLALIVMAPPSASASATVAVPHLPEDPVIVRGLASPAGGVFKVYVGDASIPVQGRYEPCAGGARFRPFFPFAPGQPYRVEVLLPGAAPLVTRFRLPASAAGATPRVIDIAPSARLLPATTLRFYIDFSASLRGRFDRRGVRLTDDAGREVTGAFMSFGQELWSADGRRLTLLLDPGRIKRGVTAHLRQGPALAPGGTYTLSVALPQSRAATTFRASAPLRAPLDPKAWRLTPPAAGTRAPLIVRFDRVMDRALLQDGVRVRSGDGRDLAGTARSVGGEREWAFTPETPWGRADYCAVFSADLEDVSGNRIGEALDHDVGSTPTQQHEFTRPFKAR